MTWMIIPDERLRRLILIAALLAVLGGLAGRLWGQTSEPTARLAILTEMGELSAVADLLTVELSAKPLLQVLEREQIEKIYREQQVSAANRSFVNLGKVLGADGLLFLERIIEGTNTFLGVRLVAVKPGVVMSDLRTPMPLQDAPDWARWVANHFTSPLLKLSVAATNAIPISVVNIHSTVRSAEALELARQLTVLTIERLTREREVFVLERRRMAPLSAEKELQEMGESSFWSGSYLLEGTIDRDTYSKGTVTVSARLVSSKGGEPRLIEASGDRGNPSEVAAKLAKLLMDSLKLRSSAAPCRPADEAEAYFADGLRAYRWAMLAEAQTASEAAWALGKRTKDVAALRLRAYGEDIVPRAVAGNIEIPAVPRVTSLNTAIRALRLFSQDICLAMTETNTLAEEWFDIGLYKALCPATAVLDGYYHAAELRAGNEEQLEELRGLARQVALVLETNVPPDRHPDGGINYPKRMDGPARRLWVEGGGLWQLGNTLWHYEWEQGGVWFDTPEDALPMFKRALETGHHPASLPRVAGWSWRDRKKVPGLLKDFVGQMCQHSNPAVRLEALYLAVVRAPFDAERQDRHCVEALIAAMWAERERIWSDPQAASLFRRAEEALAAKYRNWSSPVVMEPFATFKQRFRIEYVRNASAFENKVFGEIFPFFANYSTPAQAQELVPHLEAFAQRLKLTKAMELRNTLRKLGAEGGIQVASTLMANSKTNRPAWPAEKPIIAEFIPWKCSPLQEGTKSDLAEAQLHDGMLWGSIQHNLTNALFGASPTLSFMAVNPTTGIGEEVRFPDSVGSADGGFAVGAGHLFTTVGEQLHRYSLRNRAWEKVPVPIPSGGRTLLVANDRLYVTSPDSLLEFNPESGGVEVLISSRRSPVVNELDSRWKPGVFVYQTPDLGLGLDLGDELFTFSSTNRTWERRASLPSVNGQRRDRDGWKRDTVCDGGVLLLRMTSRFELFALWNDEKEFDYLLSADSGLAGFSRNPSPTRWDWPAGFPLDDACVLAQKRALWFMCPRKTGFAHTEEGVTFTDERHATLLHFQPEFRQPLCVSIAFARNGKLTDPFAGFHRVEMSFRNRDQFWFWLDTPQGFVLAVPGSPGHWLVPKAALETRLQVLRREFREGSPQDSKPSVTTGPQSDGKVVIGRKETPAQEAAQP